MANAGQVVPGGRIQIESQIVLPWSRTLQMTRENIFVRFGRSVITASGIFLGIAFMSAVLFGAAAGRVQQQLATSQLGLLGTESTSGETQARTIWLVGMSLLVATVGIVNSMLMSVTERYKEIGTMKCLGALDRFIVRLFILEAALLGVLGSIVGALVGTGAMTLVYTYRMGWGHALSSWHETALRLGGWSIPLWLAIVLGIVVGGLLSVCAALYPAWRAAKMPPAAALRSEF
jgi:putative ABC transport system permease protein